MNLAASLADIESRFADHLDEITILILKEDERHWLKACDEIVGHDVVIFFPSSKYEFEEAANCIALGRYTASVFHSMRVLEIGIRAISKALEIDDQVSGANRNWAIMLRGIKDRIDERWPRSSRSSNPHGDKYEQVYASLDAVRNPWRNSTMHVETIYAPHEAVHIFNCVKYFMAALTKVCDEDGHNFGDLGVET